MPALDDVHAVLPPHPSPHQIYPPGRQPEYQASVFTVSINLPG
ncbi:hypothetical protein [Lysinibacillus sp. 54212]